MSFREIAGTPERRDLTTKIKEALRTPTYARNEYQIYDNMDGDPLIPQRGRTKPASREQLLQWVESSGGDVRNALGDFCHDHVQEGPENKVAKHARLGCVRPLASVAHSSSAKIGLSVLQTKEGLRSTMAIKDPRDRLAAQRDELRDAFLSKNQIWAFYDDAAPQQSPFRALGVQRTEVVNKLGLGRFKGTAEELLYWAHRLWADIEAHTPTAWDADVSPESSPHWRPGGRTCPLDTLDPVQGYPEVVHEPVSGAALVEPISPLVD